MKINYILQIVFILLLGIALPLVFSSYYGESYYHPGDKSRVIFVDVNAKTIHGRCGSAEYPCQSIQMALGKMKQGDCNEYGFDFLYSIFKNGNAHFTKEVPTIIVKPGLYSGIENINLDIDFPINIQGISNSQNTILDCNNFGYAFSIHDAGNVQINGFTIRNCQANYGAALNITNTIVSLTDMAFVYNLASFGAVSIYKQSAILTECSFLYNGALEYGSAIYAQESSVKLVDCDIRCNTNNTKYEIYATGQSYISVDTDTSLSSVGLLCAGSSEINQGDTNKCNGATGVQGQCSNPSNPNSGVTNGNYFTCVVDGRCDFLTENCESCPSDCPQCKFQGWKLESFTQMINNFTHYLSLPESLPGKRIQHILNPIITFYMADTPTCPVSGVLSGYIKVIQTGKYWFRASGSNMGLTVFLNRDPIINQYFMNDVFDTEREVRINSEHVYSLQVMFFTVSSDVRNLTLEWKQSASDQWRPIEAFYSLNSCGDGVLDLQEINNSSMYYCPLDEKGFISYKLPECGDGICNEAPESCVTDCYSLLSPLCPGQAPPYPIPFEATDTIGKLLQNQYLFTLPGIHHLRHGLDLETGKEKPAFLFTFDYCDNSSFSIIQDMNRKLVYTIPKELFATMSPKCNFDAQSEFASSSNSFARTMSEASSMSASLTAGGGPSFLKVSMSVGYTKEESVERSREMERKEIGEMIKTDIICTSSKVQFIGYKFSISFLNDISKELKKGGDLSILINKYGMLYYKSAVLGGKVTQLTIMKTNSGKDLSSETITSGVQRSIEASLRSSYLNVEANYEDSIDTSSTRSEMQEFMRSSTRSSIISYGGAGGMFSSGSEAGDFQQWAETIDVLPIPVEYNVGFISEIIPKDWKTVIKGQVVSVQDLWIQAEDKVMQQYMKNSPGLFTDFPSDFTLSRDLTYIRLTLTENVPSFDTPLFLNITYTYANSTTGLIYTNADIFFINATTEFYKMTPPLEIIESVIYTNGTSDVPNKQVQYVITEMSNSRLYQFNSTKSTHPQVTPNLIVVFLEMVDMNQVDGLSDILQISIVGSMRTKITATKLNKLERFGNNYLKLNVTTPNYIGDILKISYTLWSDGDELNINIKSTTVYQSCPTAVSSTGLDSSGCTPAISQKSIQYGYIHYYHDKTKLYVKSMVPVDSLVSKL